MGISGATEKRPELDRLLANAHRRRFDAIVCWKFECYARSVSHLLRAFETFQALGIEFMSLTEGVPSDGKVISFSYALRSTPPAKSVGGHLWSSHPFGLRFLCTVGPGLKMKLWALI